MHRIQLDSVRQNRHLARAAAIRHGISPTLFLRQMNQEAGFRDATSPAGAQGPAQLMPATARGWHVRNVHDPAEAYDAAASHMAGYLHQFGGSWAKALTAYNAGPGAVGGKLVAETQNYIHTILRGSDHNELPAAGRVIPGTPARMIPGGTKIDEDQALIDALMQHGDPGTFFKRYQGLIASGNYTTMTPAKLQRGTAARFEKQYGVGRAPSADIKGRKIIVAANANRAGAGLSPELRAGLRQLADALGHPVQVGTGTNHNRMTVDGNVSDHWDGHAADIPLSGDALTRAGRRALITYGMDPAAARRAKGGIYNLQWRGKRVQVIFNTTQGGNHWNHLHLGIR